MKALPTKLKYSEGTKTIRTDPENYWFASMNSWDGALDHEANAAELVRRWNAHEELVEACIKLLAWIDEMRAAAFDHCAPNGAPDDTMVGFIIDAQPSDFCMNRARTAIANATT